MDVGIDSDWAINRIIDAFNKLSFVSGKHLENVEKFLF